jgi:hypothetical protein
VGNIFFNLIFRHGEGKIGWNPHRKILRKNMEE